MLTESLSQSAPTNSPISESALTDDSDEDDVIIIDGSESIETSRFLDSAKDITTKEKARRDAQIAWSIEADGIDRSIRILPGVRDMLASIPEGQYAVATSGAKTYGTSQFRPPTHSTFDVVIPISPTLSPLAHGALTRVGITPPRITITADDPRLLRGKPFPDPFLLAASCLGYPIEHCVVFEDSPSGIRAGVASGATVIAVCTSHEKEKIEGMGAHYLVKDMRCVKCEVVDGRLRFTVDEESW
jgi:beta-phosphoglucomutase-like phosphatase (HAD superfamily)